MIYGLIYYTVIIRASGTGFIADARRGHRSGGIFYSTDIEDSELLIMEQISTWAIERENETEEKSRVDNSRLTGSVKVTEIHGPAAQSVRACALPLSLRYAVACSLCVVDL